MPSPTTLIVVRHGQTLWNATHRWQGWQDSPLTPAGIEQAQAAARLIAELPIHAAYSSDSGRALQTAEILLDGRNLSATPEPALRERNYGAYEGLTTPEIEKRLPGTRFNPDHHTRENYLPPDGETLIQVRHRVVPFLDHLASTHPGRTVLLVTHSGIVRIIDALAQRLTLDDIWHRTPPNGCVFILEAAPGPILRTLRDMVDPVAVQSATLPLPTP